jgi:hypothetical protein
MRILLLPASPLPYKSAGAEGMRTRRGAARHQRRSADHGDGQACSRERAQPRSEAPPPGTTGKPRLIQVPGPVNVLHMKLEAS